MAVCSLRQQFTIKLPYSGRPPIYIHFTTIVQRKYGEVEIAAGVEDKVRLLI